MEVGPSAGFLGGKDIVNKELEVGKGKSGRRCHRGGGVGQRLARDEAGETRRAGGPARAPQMPHLLPLPPGTLSALSLHPKSCLVLHEFIHQYLLSTYDVPGVGLEQNTHHVWHKPVSRVIAHPASQLILTTMLEKGTPPSLLPSIYLYI